MKKGRLIIFIAVSFLILFAAHFAVYEGLLAIFPPLVHLWAVLLPLVFVVPIIFAASLFINSRFNNLFTRTLYVLVSVWHGLLFYLLLASALRGVFSYVTFSPVPGIIAFLSAIAVTIYGIIHEKQIHVVNVSIKLPNLSDAWKTRTAVFVSDIHLGQIHAKYFAEKVARRIRDLEPDIVFIGGDLYDGSKVDVHDIIEPFGSLKPRLGTYFVTGNHDGFSEADASIDIAAVRGLNIRVLEDEMIDIDGLQIAGVGYRDGMTADGLLGILKSMNIDHKKPSVLIKHVPDHVDAVSKAGISLMLSGHTHRAQIWPLRFLPTLIYKGFGYSLKTEGSTQVLVSSGVGTWGPPIRVGTNSEIIKINFQ